MKMAKEEKNRRGSTALEQTDLGVNKRWGEDSIYRRRRLGFLVCTGNSPNGARGKYWAGLGILDVMGLRSAE
jgi:hypothetical protein